MLVAISELTDTRFPCEVIECPDNAKFVAFAPATPDHNLFRCCERHIGNGAAYIFHVVTEGENAA